jgi:hypothetical protein
MRRKISLTLIILNLIIAIFGLIYENAALVSFAWGVIILMRINEMDFNK